MISVFGKYDPQTVARRLEVGLGWLLQSARMIHRAFETPAPQLEELAARFERERRARLCVGTQMPWTARSSASTKREG
jgi:hypothetical protein